MVRQIVRTHKGRTIDMGTFKARNGHVRAAGNSKMNARGDLLGPGGHVIKTKEQLAAEHANKVASEYNNKNPKAVDRAVSLNTPVKEMLTGTSEPVVVKTTPKVDAPKQIVTPDAPKSDIDSLKKFDVGAIVDDIETKK